MLPPQYITIEAYIRGSSPQIVELRDFVGFVAQTNKNVYIEGESGTGKELVARAIHDLSSKRDKPFVAVNCGGLTDEVLESTLFGHEKGAFTGASNTKKGYFELATGGTLFLDEITEISRKTQSALLRVLEHQEFYRMGGARQIMTDARIIAASSRDLASMVEDGKLEMPLRYRIEIANVHIPPLRARQEDIQELASYYLGQESKNYPNINQEDALISIHPEALATLLAHNWPGNIRELVNVAGRALMAEEFEKRLEPDLLKRKAIMIEKRHIENSLEGYKKSDLYNPLTWVSILSTQPIPQEGVNYAKLVNSYERSLINKALAQTGGNQKKAAILLGLNRTTLIHRIKLLEKASQTDKRVAIFHKYNGRRVLEAVRIS